MSASARVLLIDADAEQARRLAACLEGQGYEWDTETAGEAAFARFEGSGAPDIVLLGERLSDMTGFDFARRLRRERDGLAVATILLGEPPVEPCELAESVDDLVGQPFSEAELRQRLAAAVRLKTMRDELRRREATLHAYGVRDDLLGIGTVDGMNARLLLVGGDDSEAGEAARILAGEAEVTRARDAGEALDAFAHRDIELVMIAAGADPLACLDLCSSIRDNPRRFHLPIAVLAGASAFHDPAEPISHGASDVILSPLKAHDLRVRVAALVRRERLRLKVAEGYRNAARLSGKDGLTGLYTHGFLLDHLSRLVTEAVPRSTALCVAFFDVAGMARINAEHGYAAGDALLSRLGTVVSRLVRAEDLPARYDGQSFCVILPGTRPEAARIMVERIENVVSFTEFALPTVNRPVRVRLRGGLAELVPGDSAESLVERARRTARREAI